MTEFNSLDTAQRRCVSGDTMGLLPARSLDWRKTRVVTEDGGGDSGPFLEARDEWPGGEG